MSVRVVTDENGDVVKRINYDDYGRPTNPVLLRDTRTQIGFQGRLWDSQAGLYDFRTRHYDPAIGRFLQRDSIGTWGDPLNMGNAYSFVGNAPWVYTDPYGLQTNIFSRGGHPTGALGRRIISQNQFLSDGDYINHLEQSKAKTLGAIHIGLETVKAYGNASWNTLVDGTSTVAAFAVEPWDWYISGKDAFNAWRSGNKLAACSTVGAALMPGMPGQVGKAGANAAEKVIKKSPGQLDREGEAAIAAATGLEKNTQKINMDGSIRIPDFITEFTETNEPKSFIEVKNVQKLSYTRQIKAYAAYAHKNGGTLTIALPKNAHVSGPLQKAFNNEKINIFRIDLPE
jgi:RHS repeat-associated protein